MHFLVLQQNISVLSILQFRQSLSFFEAKTMFGYNFGDTDTREHCIESSEDVYARLLLRSNRDDTLSFHVLAMLALNADGTLKQEKIKDLIQIFRPQRDGTLTVLDFIKSVDNVVCMRTPLMLTEKCSEIASSRVLGSHI